MIYLLLLVWIILFKLSFSFADIDTVRLINIIPFYYESSIRLYSIEVMQNIIIFIPFGIYLMMVNISSRKIVLFGFATSVVLEASQYIFRVGRSDITDLIANTMGVIIGILLYKLLMKIFKSRCQVNNVLNILAILVTILFLLAISLLLSSNR